MTALSVIGRLRNVAYTIKEFARDYSFGGIYKTTTPYWNDNHLNPKGLRGGCIYQASNGECSLHIKDKNEGLAEDPQYYTAREADNFNKPNACRRFPLDFFTEDSLLKPSDLGLQPGGRYPLSRIWKKCGYIIEVTT